MNRPSTEMSMKKKNRIPALATLSLSGASNLDETQVSLPRTTTHAPRHRRFENLTKTAANTFVREVIPRPTAPPSSHEIDHTSGVALHEHCQSGVDIVASTDAMKQVFSMPYNPTPKSIAIHRVGRRLVVGTSMESESQRISRRYKKQSKSSMAVSPRILCSPTAAAPSGNPFFTRTWSDFDEDDCDDEVTHLVTDPETGEIFLVSEALPTLEDKVQESLQHGLHDRFLHDTLSRVSFPLELTMTESVPPSLLHPSSFQQLVRWQFNSMEMLLGSNTVIFKHNNAAVDAINNDSDVAATSVRLQSDTDDATKLTSLVCLDTWLDNVMNNLHQTAFCFHRDGHVQGYQMVRTEDLPFVHDPSLFDAHAVFQNAQSILSFLQEHCVDEAQTYWLTKSPQTGRLHLFQLPTKVSSTADHTVGMLCFQLANSIASDAAHDVRRAQRLYSKCIQLVDAAACPDVVAQACLALATTFIRPHVRPSLAVSLLVGEADACLRAKSMLDQLSAALDACEAFAKQDGKHSIASLFEIAQRYLPTKPQSHAADFMAEPPPLLDDEAQEKEDFEQALVVFAEGVKYAPEDSTTEMNLHHGLLACYYVLAHFAIHELDLGTALSHCHTLLDLLPSFHYPQVNLLVAKVHLRLATQSNVDNHHCARYAMAERSKPTLFASGAKTDGPPPAWVHMSRSMAVQWAMDTEQHLNIAVSSAMHLGTLSKAHEMLPLLPVGRDMVNDTFRQLLRDAYVSQARHLVATGRHTKGARHAEQGLVLFSSIGDTVAGIEMRVLLGEIALRHATQSSGFHKAIAAFTRARSDLWHLMAHDGATKAPPVASTTTIESGDWTLALQVHVLLLLRLAHAHHALHLQEGMSRDALCNVDCRSGWTAAQSAVRDELRQCLAYSQEALDLCSTSTKTMWRVADAHYLLACLYSSHLGLNLQYKEKGDVGLMASCVGHYNAALETLPLTFESCVHHLLLRLDMVKFLLSVGTKIEATLGDPSIEAPAQWTALVCLVQSAALYNLPVDTSVDDQQRISLLLQGLFRLIEQQAHGCMKHLIKTKFVHADLIKQCYLAWIQDASKHLPPCQILQRAATSLTALAN
ncbi:Aste57867_18875 [Aphanomyces stellatus]|uniref:Aste57867_18875 protein n=1 Tax=Aphanomyces stellatus TaxID=120398 RepID=A0A485LB77_9STRA|nr:hypothetical protein As57867_018811 [Aphanomyces stellatus]VFT95609.1 Aste57867_18875 [Aphanomyces stellatus]